MDQQRADQIWLPPGSTYFYVFLNLNGDGSLLELKKRESVLMISPHKHISPFISDLRWGVILKIQNKSGI